MIKIRFQYTRYREVIRPCCPELCFLCCLTAAAALHRNLSESKDLKERGRDGFGVAFFSTAFMVTPDPHNRLKAEDNTGMIGSRGSRRD